MGYGCRSQEGCSYETQEVAKRLSQEEGKLVGLNQRLAVKRQQYHLETMFKDFELCLGAQRRELKRKVI